MILGQTLGAAELVTFSSGFQMTVDSHRLDDTQYVLLQPGGAIQVARQSVASIELIPSEAVPATTPVAPPAKSLSAAVSVPQAQALLAEAAEEAGLPATLVLSVAKVESAFLSAAKSAKGAVGLMQIMPATASALGIALEDPRANAFGGAQYLRQLLIRYRGEARLALAAYNAGPAAVDRFHEVPPIEETQAYVERVLREYDRLEAAQQQASRLRSPSGSVQKRQSSVEAQAGKSSQSASIAGTN
jgi:soluble lytic murein transglycosylase-like protein